MYNTGYVPLLHGNKSCVLQKFPHKQAADHHKKVTVGVTMKLFLEYNLGLKLIPGQLTHPNY